MPLKQNWSGSLDAVLALAIRILEKVEATWQEKPILAAGNGLRAEIAEVGLRDSALLRHSRRRLAAISNDEVLAAICWLVSVKLLCIDFLLFFVSTATS